MMIVTPLLLMLAVPVVLMTVAALVALVALVGRQVWRVLLLLLVVVAVGLLAVVGGARYLRQTRTITIVAPQAVERPEQEIARQIAELERRVDELRRLQEQARSRTAAEPSRSISRAEDAVTPTPNEGTGDRTASVVLQARAEVVSDQQLQELQGEPVAAGQSAPLQFEAGGMAAGDSAPSDHAQVRPTWVGSPRHWEGRVHTMSLAIGPYSTLDECQRLVKREAEKAIAQYDDWYLGQRGGSHRMLIPPAKYPEDWTDPENCYHEITQSRLLGEKMHSLHVRLRFPESYRTQLDACWQQTVAAGRLIRVALIAGAVLALLAMVYLYLRLDLVTKGCYTRRLQCALAGTILALAAAGLLLARWIPWI